MKTKLTCENLFLIQGCLDAEQRRLQELHWQILPFMPFSENRIKNYTEGQIKVLRNLELQRIKLEKAREQIGKIFEEQFDNEKG